MKIFCVLYLIGAPATQTREISATAKKLADGVDVSGYHYASVSPVKENMTYAFRVIAYRGELFTRLYGAFYYNILDGDKRVDMTAVFRVVRKSKDGSLTLLWKELQRKDSPKIRISKEDEEKYIVKPL